MLLELQSRFRQSLPPALLDDFDNLLRLTAVQQTSALGRASGGASTVSLSFLGPTHLGVAPTVDLDAPGRAEDESTSDDGVLLGTGERYEDLGLLGTGGMGEVRRVRDVDLGRTMAMKIIRSDLSTRPHVLARFIEEAQCSAQLQHPGIVPVHELGRLPDGRFYFTMREVTGRTLGDVIAEVHRASKGDRWQAGATGWAFRGLVDAFHRVCEAVAYAHSRGVIHRDLKPDNIMVGGHGEVLVVDWGLAKVVGRPDLAAEAGELDPVVTDRSQDAAQVTRMGAVAGTPAYMPPEQAGGAIDQIDARSDVYALGAILYEILSGRPPYEGDSGGAVLAKVRSGPPEPPGRGVGLSDTLHAGFGEDEESAGPSELASVASPPLPAELVAACNQAMSRHADGRFADAGVLAAEVAAWLDGARRREQALEVVAQAEAHAPEVAALHTRAAGLEAESVALLATIEGWQPEEDKLAGWSKADEAAGLRQEAERRDVQREQGLTGALRIDPSLPEAHVALVERHRAAHTAAEQARQADVAARAAHLLQSHADALPADHPVRQRSAVYLKGDGALTLVTDPPGAEVLLHRYELHNRRLVPVLQRSLGRTPLSAVSLPMGSYLCVLRSQGRADVRYPVHIGRGAHWHGVPPGGHEPQAIGLPDAAELGLDDCHVPAGWFTAGGDPDAPSSLSRRQVWVDGCCLSRFPVTNRDYIGFLDDLVTQGREEEALRHAPRERAGTQGDLGALIYGYESGRFSLREDAEGDVWSSDWPVFLVDWHGAVAFAAWQAARTGQAWRLPHELEWEKAGRGVDGRFYPWGDAFDPSWCHTQDSHRGRLLPASIGQYPVDESVYGARGLAGNTRDWTGTAHQDDADVRDGVAVSSQQSAGQAGAHRVFRGGSWFDDPCRTRLCYRHQGNPDRRLNVLGFRLARSLP